MSATIPPASDEKQKIFKQGMDIAKKMIALRPDRVEGHYWLGVHTGSYGEARGVLKSLFLKNDIIRAMNKAVAIDGAYEQGGAYCVLGRLYFKVPGLFGGSNKKSRQYLEKCRTDRPEKLRLPAVPRRDLLGAGRGEARRQDPGGAPDHGTRPELGPGDRKGQGRREETAAKVQKMSAAPLAIERHFEVNLEMANKYILAINPGSTSTKIAIFLRRGKDPRPEHFAHGRGTGPVPQDHRPAPFPPESDPRLPEGA